MKRLALAVTLISAALLSGCIVVPAHRYHGGGGYERGYERGYDRGHDRGDRDGYGPGRR